MQEMRLQEVREKGGLTEADIKAGALKATMDLAAYFGMDLGEAANVVVQAMGAFGMLRMSLQKRQTLWPGQQLHLLRM